MTMYSTAATDNTGNLFYLKVCFCWNRIHRSKCRRKNRNKKRMP